MNPSDLVFDGALWAGVLIAALAGFVSFASPCVLPLVPAYVSYVAKVGSGLRVRSRSVQQELRHRLLSLLTREPPSPLQR